MTITTKLGFTLPKPSQGTNKAFAAECEKILADYKSGELSEAQFLEACQYLDEAARAFEIARRDMWKRINKE